ncbi:mitochondrial cytochrome-like protein b2 [Coniochaeta ligniaria NRRL 30616]|uniref:Mitochondrial cytochrome-like protein b2 n=1 Tax=Coniochaeta ligniaria NRRL 30616 TaxID=1408157 RepID=A0A1J7J503_9PEZI|nr:mitochondrial cytochrome-like protein b2 [Coniochaeta ligniaria NRRL 30616]
MLDGAEVAKHATRESCWIVIDSKVYDVTSFLFRHPGGAAILLRQAGSDATAEFAKVHPLDYVQELPEGSCLGPLDPKTATSLNSPKPQPSREVVSTEELPHPSLCVTTGDFEAAAKSALPHRFWTYVSGSANSGLSLKGNLDDWARIRFRPRVLRNVGTVDMGGSILGHKTQFPFYVSAMGTMGNIHPGAEPETVRGIVRKGLHGVISTASTKTPDEIMDSYRREQSQVGDASPSVLFFQLYLPTDREKAVALIKRAKAAGYQGIWLTVDTPLLGKRTADRRLQAIEALSMGLEQEQTPNRPIGGENSLAPAFGGRDVPGQLSPHTTWEDLKWIRDAWQGPIVLKGIQCADDAKLAMEHGCEGILLSNHGGRQLHTAPSALMTLLEIRTYCPEVLDKLEVYVDGGLRDGADVLKAICLGATAVGVGRPYLYALAAYGSRGIERCTDSKSSMLRFGVLRVTLLTTFKYCRKNWRLL